MRAVVLALVLLAPLAAADHVYSHRFLVVGRLVDGDGLPVPGVPVQVSTEGESFRSACQEGHSPVTNVAGDFGFCYHRHEVNASAIVTVRAGNASQSRPIDADLRRMVFRIADPTARGVAPDQWNETFRVEGRVWERGALVLDGVVVNGVALADAEVNVSLVTPDAQPTSFLIRTDAFGDYHATLRLLPGHRAEDLRVVVAAQGASFLLPLDTRHHLVVQDVVLPVEAEDVPFPGTTTPPLSVQMLLVVAAGAVAAVLFARRRA